MGGSLEIRKQLRRDTPQSAQAACGLSVSLNTLAGFLANRGQPGDAERALTMQMQALHIFRELFDNNPSSVYYGRTVGISFFLTFQRAQTAENPEFSIECLAGWHTVLYKLVTADFHLDPPMMRLYQQLNDAAGGNPKAGF